MHKLQRQFRNLGLETPGYNTDNSWESMYGPFDHLSVTSSSWESLHPPFDEPTVTNNSRESLYQLFDVWREASQLALNLKYNDFGLTVYRSRLYFRYVERDHIDYALLVTFRVLSN